MANRAGLPLPLGLAPPPTRLRPADCRWHLRPADQPSCQLLKKQRPKLKFAAPPARGCEPGTWRGPSRAFSARPSPALLASLTGTLKAGGPQELGALPRRFQATEWRPGPAQASCWGRGGAWSHTAPWLQAEVLRPLGPWQSRVLGSPRSCVPVDRGPGNLHFPEAGARLGGWSMRLAGTAPQGQAIPKTRSRLLVGP